MSNVKKIKEFNPFYAALVIAGVLFLITASLYGVVAVKKVDPLVAGAVPAKDAAFVEFVDQKGPGILIVELAFLGLTSIGAMATDGYWIRRAEKKLAAK